jgi:Leucine-rich repeat (LRR) protein
MVSPIASVGIQTPAICSSSRNVRARSGANGGGIMDASLRVKFMLAETSGKLDLSECNLSEVPPEIFDVKGLEELSLAGNRLKALPADIGRLTELRRLQLAGNGLTKLPDEIGGLKHLEGLWVHGNLLEELPCSIGELGALKQLSIAGNVLVNLPSSIAHLTSLYELGAAGNRLNALPKDFGALVGLHKLALHGNELQHLPASINGLVSLKELWLQGNSCLTSLPAELGALPALQHLSAADCSLVHVSGSIGNIPTLKTLSLYGNYLKSVPAELITASSSLESLWLENNPLQPSAVNSLLEATVMTHGGRFDALGLGADQLQQEGVSGELVKAAKSRIRQCEVCGQGAGYMKLERASGGDTDGKVLVIAFGSAPGVPNWGGALRRVREAAETAAEADFDVLYVVDPARGWYGGGSDDEFAQWEVRIADVAKRYPNGVVMIGESMGASATLMLAAHATSVHAFCPQVDLTSSSIRPAHGEGWFDTMRRRILDGVMSCPGKVTVHVGNWRHDLSQVNLLPREASCLHVHLYSLDSHRLAAALDRTGKLLPLLRAAILNEMDLSGGLVRIANMF